MGRRFTQTKWARNLAGCQQKTPYSSTRFARMIAQRRLAEDPDQHLYIYLCNVCGKYHLTSRRGGMDVIEEVVPA